MTARLTDYLKSEFDKKLASIPGDNERYRECILQHNVWTQRYRAFFLGKQPFGGPHPEFGHMTAGDFLIVLGMISAERSKLERVPA